MLNVYEVDEVDRDFYSLDYKPNDINWLDKFDEVKQNLRSMSVKEVADYLLKNPKELYLANIIYELVGLINNSKTIKTEQFRKRKVRTYATEEQKKNSKYRKYRKRNTEATRRSRERSHKLIKKY